MELPKFKFSPNAYNLNVFEKEDGVCSCCKENKALKYTGSFYSEEEPDYICPWCIENGNAAEMFEGEFNDYQGIENSDGIDENLLIEISERTPSYNSWQQEIWLTHCDEPCKLIGYADGEIINPIIDELENDINDKGYDKEFLLKNLSIDGSLVGYLFQCTKCNTHRLHIDCD